MSRTIRVVRYVLSAAFAVTCLVQLWYCVRLWHDLMDRAVYMLDENTITTTATGVQLSFFGGLIAFILAFSFLSMAFKAFPPSTT